MKELDRQIVRIFSAVSPKKVILFGSRATGRADRHSDFDLIVVYETRKRFLDRLEELYGLWDLPFAVDILAYTPEEFEKLSVESAFVVHALEVGRVILEAA